MFRVFGTVHEKSIIPVQQRVLGNVPITHLAPRQPTRSDRTLLLVFLYLSARVFEGNYGEVKVGIGLQVNLNLFLVMLDV